MSKQEPSNDAAKRRANAPTYGGRPANRDNEAGYLANEFIKHNYQALSGQRLLHRFQRQFYKYTGTHYVQMDEDSLKMQVYKFVRENAVSKRTSGLLDVTWKFLCAEITLTEERSFNTWLSQPPGCQDAGRYIAVQNGIINVDQPAQPLMKHNPDWFSLTCLPFNFDADGECPNWGVFLESCFGDDEERIALLQEWFGYCLTADNSLNKFMLFEGPPRAGKGVTADTLMSLLGSSNVSEIGLEMFEDRFAITESVGKLLNLCDETDQIERVAEARIKRFTGSTGKIYFDVKGVRGFSASFTARILIISNNGIPIYDRSTALVSRMLHLQFDKSHVGKEDIGLRARLQGELPGIFNWALTGYARIRAQREFTLPARSAEALKHYAEASNPFKVWFDDMIEVTGREADYIGKRELLTAHNTWLKEGGHKPISEVLCGRQVRQIASQVKDGKRPAQTPEGVFYRSNVYVGIKWKSEQ